MPVGDITLFNAAKLGLINGLHDLDTHTIKLAIVDNTTAPTEAMVSPALTSFTEVLTTGTYTAGGVTLTISLTESAGIVTFDATNNPTWLLDALNGTNAYWGIIYNSSAAGKDAIGYVDLSGPVDMTLDDLVVTWHPSGLFQMQVF